MMMLRRLGASTPMTRMASRMKGNASWMSARRMKKSSTRPPKYPATRPMAMPRTPEIITAASPTESPMRAAGVVGEEAAAAAADAPRHEADGHAEDTGDHHRRQPHRERDAGAVDDAREDV